MVTGRRHLPYRKRTMRSGCTGVPALRLRMKMKKNILWCADYERTKHCQQWQAVRLSPRMRRRKMKFHTVGNESGKIIVLIHGMLNPWQIWMDVANAFIPRSCTHRILRMSIYRINQHKLPLGRDIKNAGLFFSWRRDRRSIVLTVQY